MLGGKCVKRMYEKGVKGYVHHIGGPPGLKMQLPADRVGAGPRDAVVPGEVLVEVQHEAAGTGRRGGRVPARGGVAEEVREALGVAPGVPPRIDLKTLSPTAFRHLKRCL